MLEKNLAEIANIDSVETVAVVTYRGDVAAVKGKALSQQQLEELSKRILSIYAINYAQQKRITELEFYWQNRFIIVKASDHFVIITVCRSIKVLSLLRITLNVTLAQLLEDKKFNKWLKDHRADRTWMLKKISWTEKEQQLINRIQNSA